MKKFNKSGKIVFLVVLFCFLKSLQAVSAANSLELQEGIYVYVYYNSLAEPPLNLPQPKVFNLENYILQLPDNLTLENLNYSIIGDGLLENGSLEPLNAAQVTFIPSLQDFREGIASTFSYEVSGRGSDNIYYSKTAEIKIVVLDYNIKENIPGYFNNSEVRCYEDMGIVDFLPRYKFISGAFNDANVESQYGISVSNPKNGTYINGGRLYEFQVTLAGDLDGDGKPEVVALGVDDSETEVNPYCKYIYIFDGQNGKILTRYDLTNLGISWYLGSRGHHGSPGMMALVDSDRNGTREIILAPGSSSNKNLFSFIVLKNNQNVWSIQLNTNWPSGGSARYDTYSGGTYTNQEFSKPVVQIVDINVDGIPEIIAYNKIYNAVNGNLLLTMDNLTNTYSANKAFVGRDSLARELDAVGNLPGDHQVGFSYIYDVDFDGHYEICAGGKVYYDIDLLSASKTYKVLDANKYIQETIPDGHTSVADIDGDGKPEIIVSFLTEKNYTTGSMRIVVWTPHLENGNLGATLKAKIDIPFNNMNSGSHSYLYVADIDGKEQYGRKYPEISILGPRFFSTSTMWTGYPVHPNVASEMRTQYPITTAVVRGAILSLTWDGTPNLPVDQRLKVSFMMEHEDTSTDTGFTLFDFNNDGVNNICYRDQQYLRIIAASTPFVKVNETSPSIIRFRSPIKSGTGFEYPVITDLDGDFSADMIVTGNELESGKAVGFLYAVEGAHANLAPSKIVWNQFMYSPLKIRDDLQVPLPGEFEHPLSPNYAFFLKDTDTYETFIFNNTLTQIPLFTVFEKNGKRYLKPIVKTPDAVIDTVVINTNVRNGFPYGSLDFSIYNSGDASLNQNTPIKIYKDSVSQNSIYKELIVGKIIYPGVDTVFYEIPFVNLNDDKDTYIIRVSDDSYMDGKGDVWRTDNSSHKDCYWPDNEVEIGIFVFKSDYYTLYPGEEVVLDILLNDIFTIYEQSSEVIPTLIDFTFVYPEREYGTLTFIENNSKIQYKAPSAPGGLVHILYTINAFGVKKTGNVYIYILDNCADESPNIGDIYTLCMKKLPSDIRFKWYDEELNLLENNQLLFPIVSEDPLTFFVRPIFDNVAGYAYLKDYLPQRQFDVTPQLRPRNLRWMGYDTDWNDYNNWIEIRGNMELPVYLPPKRSDNVELPSGRSFYPILTAPAECSNIDIKDRAMIAGIQYLTYDNVEIIFLLKLRERDRFIMWSAPLMSVFSGDYHFKTDNDQYYWGDVYMNFFQSSNPDNGSSVPVPDMFTATFGSPNKELPLGQAFNLKVINTDFNRSKLFTFPQNYISYTDELGITYPVPRIADKAKKFITDNAVPHEDSDGSIRLPLYGRTTGKLIQVVNPYVAYLDVKKFLDANSAYIESSYKIWSGEIGQDNITVYIGEVEKEGQRLIITDGNLPMEQADDLTQIAPFQSFFVMSKSNSQNINYLKMSPEWTTTLNYNQTSDDPDYQLKLKGNKEKDILRINVALNNSESATVLHYDPDAVPEYDAKEDSYKLIYDETPVSVYLFTPQDEPLALYSSNDFSSEISLGLRCRESGNITLKFQRFPGFDYDVYLIDKIIGKQYAIQDAIQIEFYHSDLGNASAVYINDRFSLRFEYNPSIIEEKNIPNLFISSNDGYLYLSSSGPEISTVQIFTMDSNVVYNNEVRSNHAQIRLKKHKLYLIKAKIEDEYIIRKAFIQ